MKRTMERVIPGTALALAMILLVAGVTPPEPAMAAPARETVYKVVWPESHWAGKAIPLAPRLSSLEGKTIAFLGGGFRAEEMFPILESLLRAKYSNIKFIPLGQLPTLTASEPGGPELAELSAALKSKGADATFSGVGG